MKFEWNPYKNILIAIVIQAINDLRIEPDKCSWECNRMYARIRKKEAQSFIESDIFEDYIGLIGIKWDIDRLRKQLFNNGSDKKYYVKNKVIKLEDFND